MILGVRSYCEQLHPLKVPDGRCELIAMDFIGPLPEDDSYDCILMITDRLGSDIQIIPTRMDIMAEELSKTIQKPCIVGHPLPENLMALPVSCDVPHICQLCPQH